MGWKIDWIETSGTCYSSGGEIEGQRFSVFAAYRWRWKEKERDALVSYGWQYEGIGWYSDDAKSVPLYREYNPNMVKCNHNYTTNKKEHDALTTLLGWKDEGIGWYGVNH